ncbi:MULTISPECIES: autotransporter-associated beta strand repeat-containing protein [unclassified Novosphingobium]|uniref:autotransporter-associated beta strand repeat-containing protein n=1 Tax=unclassified Novosphingobium TaxID=2644732 RepID=UPI00146CCF2D|nr:MULTISPECIES: autotransporter-associated beta strand repeat-containing protein [unclassified Novosphingobium]NMN03174.1 autotransporter-associated beta strand protein [Novosphingobium sp. SG919]NMN86836.1 autotransporter-associated beta strand protein [Novosphingobium sp. SG916]
MKIASLLRLSSSTLAASLALASGAQAAPSNTVTVVDGSDAAGVIVASGASQTAGSADGTTIYTNFFTEGGAGSGGGGGLGGVFFVDQGGTLTLNNVQFKSNTAKGGEGGGIAVAQIAPVVVPLANLTVEAQETSIQQATPTVTKVGGTYYITGVTMSSANGMLGAGATVQIKGTESTGTIAAVNGAAVTFAGQGIAVDASHVAAVSGGTVSFSGAATSSNVVDVSSSHFTPSQLGIGMAVVGDGIPAGTTITAVTYGTNNAVTSVTLSNAIVRADPGQASQAASFDVIGAGEYQASRFKSVTANSIQATGVKLAGLQAGMQVTAARFDGSTFTTSIQSIASDGTITFADPVDGMSGFSASTAGGTAGSNVIRLSGANATLAVGMTVTGTGIPDGTVVLAVDGGVITLSNPLSQASVDAIADGSLFLSFGKVISSGNSTLTLASTAGLKVGMLMTGDGVPENAVITAINQVTGVVSYRIDSSASSLNTGGAMNGLVAAGSGSTGGNGQGGSMYNTIFHDGEGVSGTNGYDAGATPTGGSGGKGGMGGNGTRGLPYNMDLMLSFASQVIDINADFVEAAAEGAPDPLPKPTVAAAKIANTVQKIVNVIQTGVDLVNWQVELGLGLVAHGGDGGSGGAGGDGDTFFGGGQGGAGGSGGDGATVRTDGGAGGDGGDGGAGGFGAGGGSGGAGGAGGWGGNSADGGDGAGGTAGFGGGVGSSDDGTGGGGGSGYGGAIFVRTGGSLNITGNALFENNAVLAGSSNNGGEAGQSAGSDLFMMKGSMVTLAPGAGHTIRFEGTIADDSAASIGGASYAPGAGADIHVTGGGLVQFLGANTYTGNTYIEGATLQAEDGQGINTNSHILFNGSSTIGADLSNDTAGVLLTSGTMVRRVGSLPHQLSWSGSGGFAAGDDGLTLNFGALTSTTGQSLTWNAGGFVPVDATLLFGSDYGTGVVTLVNTVNLAGLNGRVAVYDNADADSDAAVLSGVWRNGTLEVNDTSYAGTLTMTAQNSLDGVTLHNGLLETTLDGTSGRLMNATSGGFVTISGGTLNLRVAEKLTTVTVAQAGTLNAYGTVSTGAIANDGEITFHAAAQTGTIVNTGLLAFLGGATTGTITNAGLLGLTGGDSATGSVVNSGWMIATDHLSVNGSFTNVDGGLFHMVGDITTSGRFTNDGVMVVVGDTDGDGAELAAVRHLVTTGFQDPTGVTQLGGMSGTVANTLDLDQSGDSTYAGVFIGAGSLIKRGAGWLTLTGENSFTGGLAVAAGGIDTTGGGTLADSLAVTVADGAALRLGTTDSFAALDNQGETTVTAPTTITLDDYANSGQTTVDGRLIVNHLATNTGLTLIATDASAWMQDLVNAGGTVRNLGTLAVAARIENQAEALLDLAASSQTTAATLDNAGLVQLDGTLGVSGAMTSSGTVLVSDQAGAVLGSLENSGTLHSDGLLDVAGLLGNTATGTMQLTASASTYAGTLGNAGNFSSAGMLFVDGMTTNEATGTMAFAATAQTVLSGLANAGIITAEADIRDYGVYTQDAGSLTTTRNLFVGTFSGAGGAVHLGVGAYFEVNQEADGTYSGVVDTARREDGTGAIFAKYGTGTLTLAGGPQSFSTWSMDLWNGTVAVDGDDTLDHALRVSIDQAATLRLDNGNQTIGWLSGNGTIALGANTLTVDQAADTTFAGVIGGSGNFTKTGDGELFLTGANTFTGTLVVDGGTLNTFGGGTLADSATVNVGSAGTFVIGTDDAIAGLTNAGMVHVAAHSTVTTIANSGQVNVWDHLTLGDLGSNGEDGTIAIAQGATLDGYGLQSYGTVYNDGTLDLSLGFGNAGTATFSAGSVNHFGALGNLGTITSAADIVVTGQTVMAGGSITTTANYATGTLSGSGGAFHLGAASVLTINQTEDATFAGSIDTARNPDGSGAAVVKTGSATLTLAGGAGSFAPATLAIMDGGITVAGADVLDHALQVYVATPARLSLTGGDQTINNLTGTGTLALNGNHLILANGGNFAGTVTGAGDVALDSGTFNLANTITSASGTFQVQDGSTMNVLSSGTLNAPQVAVGGVMNLTGTVNATATTVDDGGTLHLGNANGSAGGTLNTTTLVVDNQGTLTGVGSVGGSAQFGGTSTGTLAPGNSPGVIHFTNLALANHAVAVMDVEGAAGAGLSAADGGYDQVVVSGTLAIDQGASLQIANSTGFTLALGQKVTLFRFAPGAVSGHFGTVSSAMGKAVAFNLATGTLVGLGDYTPASFEAALGKNANQKAMVEQLRVASAGGVNQYYGGRLIEYAATALGSGSNADAAVASVFAKASPEAYAGLAQHLRVSLLDNLLDLSGYDMVDKPSFAVTGGFGTGQAKGRDGAGYSRLASTDHRFNLGVAAQVPFARAQFGFTHSDGHVSTALMRGDAKGDQYSFGVSVPVTHDGALRLTARAAFADYTFKGTRVTNAGTASFGDVHGSSSLYGGGLEYRRVTGKLSLDLTGEVLAMVNKVDGFAESGAPTLDSLAVAAQRDAFTALSGGIKLGYRLAPRVQGFANVSAVQDLDSGLPAVQARVAVEDTLFTVHNPGFARTRAKLGLGGQIDLSDAISWTFEGNVGTASSYGGKTALTIRF